MSDTNITTSQAGQVSNTAPDTSQLSPARRKNAKTLQRDLTIEKITQNMRFLFCWILPLCHLFALGPGGWIPAGIILTAKHHFCSEICQ